MQPISFPSEAAGWSLACSRRSVNQYILATINPKAEQESRAKADGAFWAGGSPEQGDG